MNFEQVIRQLKETEALTAEIQRSQARVQENRADNVIYMEESMRLHEQRMAHIDMRLAAITKKLDLMGGFKEPQ